VSDLDQDLHALAPPPLQYATPAERKSRYPEFQFIARVWQRVVPRLLFAAGAAMVMGGLGGALSRDPGIVLVMGGGAALMALAGPWGGPQQPRA
jgi:hypothetical protein